MNMDDDIGAALQANLRHPARTGYFTNAIREHRFLQFDRMNYRIAVACNLWDSRNGS